MSGNVNKCSKTRRATCKGCVANPKGTSVWVYWCGVKKDGWQDTPCDCKKDKK